MSSNVSTPYLEPTPTQTFTQPSPSPLANSPTQGSAVNDDDIPSLSLDVLSSHDDKVAALRLVADSIAQQRQQAAISLIFHPLPLAVLTAALAATYHFAWVRHHGDLGLTLVTVCGVIMSYLLAVRYFTSPYIQLAEDLRWDWLVAPSNGSGNGGNGGSGGEEDVIIATRFGDEVVGALVLRLEPNPALAGKKRHRSLTLKGGKGVVRAWTTKMRYRGKGVGGDMLQKAVRVTRERCGRDAEVGFARGHANSTMVLPDMFNSQFRKSEVRAAKALEAVLADLERNKKKR